MKRRNAKALPCRTPGSQARHVPRAFPHGPEGRACQVAPGHDARVAHALATRARARAPCHHEPIPRPAVVRARRARVRARLPRLLHDARDRGSGRRRVGLGRRVGVRRRRAVAGSGHHHGNGPDVPLARGLSLGRPGRLVRPGDRRSGRARDVGAEHRADHGHHPPARDRAAERRRHRDPADRRGRSSREDDAGPAGPLRSVGRRRGRRARRGWRAGRGRRGRRRRTRHREGGQPRVVLVERHGGGLLLD